MLPFQSLNKCCSILSANINTSGEKFILEKSYFSCFGKSSVVFQKQRAGYIKEYHVKKCSFLKMRKVASYIQTLNQPKLKPICFRLNNVIHYFNMFCFFTKDFSDLMQQMDQIVQIKDFFFIFILYFIFFLVMEIWQLNCKC